MTRHRSFSLIHFLSTGIRLSAEIVQMGRVAFRSHASLVAENLFLRKQLAFYGERKIKPHCMSDAARLALVFWSRWFDWKNALVVVKPATLIGRHRKAFQLFWRWKSRGGRPQLPSELRNLIDEMVRENPTWGQARIAAELSLKLGIRISPRTVRAHWPRSKPKSRSHIPALDDLRAKPCQGHRGL
jgi:hypothetical protein